MSASAVGAALGGIGSKLPSGLSETAVLCAATATCFLLAAATAGQWNIRVPQIPRQVNGWLGKVASTQRAAVLWGIDLGLTFTTWLTFSGAWAVALLVFARGVVAEGVLVFAALWTGRALSVALAPAALSHPAATPQLLDEIRKYEPRMRYMHAAALAALGFLMADHAMRQAGVL